MARKIAKDDPSMATVATAFNELHDFVVAQLRLSKADPTTVDNNGSHNDKSEVTITAANASDLATSLTLVNQLLGVYAFHMADTLAHKTAGVALASYVHATDLTSAIARANDIKAKYETHRASTTYHYAADSTNTISSSDATDQSSLNTLLNELKTDIGAHMVSGPTCKSLRTF